MRIIKLGLALALAATVAACQKPVAQVDGARIAAADTNAEWVSYGKGYSEQRFSPLDKINAGNVGQLGLGRERLPLRLFQACRVHFGLVAQLRRVFCRFKPHPTGE